MIDLHCHILPNVDDGARTIQESLELLREAQKIGYKKICCTSHYMNKKYENQNYDNSLKELKLQLKVNKIDLELLEGNELFLDLHCIDSLKEEKVKTLNNSKYLLVEIIPGMTEIALKKTLKQIMDLGYRPVLAHVERYPFINIKTLYQLKKMGIIIQVNLRSLKNTKETYEWIKLGLVDVLASDVHNIKYRNYNFEEIIEELDNNLGLKKIINNEDIEGNIDEEKINGISTDDIGVVKRFFKKFKFRRST